MNIFTLHTGRAAAVGLIAAFAATAWLALNVAGNYGGQVSGLFYTGSHRALPDGLGPTWRVNDEVGFDGQFYRLVAHDPLLRRGFAAFADNPSLRWRRIGVPGLAALLVAGNDRVVDTAYVAVELAFVFLGAFWLAQYAECSRRSAAWGLAFLLIPAVLISLERMTVDLALAALAIGLARYGTDPPRPLAWLLLCAAPLVRETGMVLVAAWCVFFALRRQGRAAMLGAACAIPALAWWIYVARRTAPDSTPWLSGYPFGGIVDRGIAAMHSLNATTWLQTAALLEEVAFAGIGLALALSFYLAWKRRLGLLEVTAVTFSTFAATLGKSDIWESAYAAGRTMSPLLIVLALISLRECRPVFTVPLLLILPRLALQYQAQIAAALRGLW